MDIALALAPRAASPSANTDDPARSSAPPASSAPLAGVRVLDLTRLLPGPVCTLHLADMGAEVVKIEDMGAGDYATPALRALVHRNKRALRLDLKQPAGVEALKRLAARADVLVESFRPGVMDRLGVGYETLSRLNPRLVYCSITGFGQTGPLRDEPGHDLNYCALAGITDQLGRDGDTPALPNMPVADLLGGSLSSVMGILAALFDAARSGQGRHVDIAMTDAVLAHAVVPMVSLAVHGRSRPAAEEKLAGALPCYSLYRTQDGRQLAVGALEHKFWERFCEVMEREDWKALHIPKTQAVSDALRAEVAERIAGRPLEHWARKFEGTGCCVTPVLRPEEVLRHPHFQARGMVLAAPEADGPARLACPVKMSRFEFEVRNEAPAPGQDSDAILLEAGYDADSVAALKRAGAVG